MQAQKIKFILSFLFLFALLGLLWRELFFAKPNELPSVLIGEPVPHFSLKSVQQPNSLFTHNDLSGHVSLLNVWATWCFACTQETDMLMKIKNVYHVPIYGIDYKDDPKEAMAWLTKYGNPYELIGSDSQGDTAIDLGVYGTPETFVISAQGIVYAIGVIDQGMTYCIRDWQ